ncbi:MAG: hypothetical protein V4760_08535 [Bdellovibrionota bacterium]
MKNQNFNLMIATLAALAITGCGETSTKSNPLEDYKDLKTVPQYKGNEPRVQVYPNSPLFGIMIEKTLNFVEGEATSYVVTPRCQIPGAAFKLVAKDLPQGATLAPVDASKPMGDYKLTWTPAVGTLPAQSIWAPYDAEIEVVVLKGADAAADEKMATVAVPKPLTMVLLATSEQPTVVKCELASGVACAGGNLQITEGDKIAITLTVKDPGASAGRLPRIALEQDQSENNELPRVAGLRASTKRNPESLGGGLFRFKGIIDTKGVEFPGSAKSASARLIAYVVGAKFTSPDETIEFGVAKKVEAPAAAPAAAPVAPVEKPAAKPAPAKSAANKPAASNTKPAAPAAANSGNAPAAPAAPAPTNSNAPAAPAAGENK